MALTDLKSDLSRFRMPKKDPLVNKKRESVKKKQNQTPLSKFLETRPDINQIQKTPTKLATDVSKFDNSSKFLGETSPDKMDNSSNFLGETSPSKVDNSTNFLGETTPSKMDNSSNFLGETTAPAADNSSKFLGETTPNIFSNSSNFLGETNPNIFNNNLQFLGETTPSIFSNSSNFLGETTMNQMDNSLQFLGETTMNPMDNSIQDLGLAKLKIQNNFSDIHAKGFTPFFDKVDDTKFVGINPSLTIFDSTNSKFSDFNNAYRGISFQAGHREFKVGKYIGDTQRYNPDVSYFKDNELSTKGIGELQEMRNSNSFLDKMYNKFNLQADSHNSVYPNYYPLILRGIQRSGLGNGEEQFYGFPGVDDGLSRGGIVTSTARAAIDVARITKFLVTPKGQLWGAKQIGLQRTNSVNKIWTPNNLLTAVGSAHLGFKPLRSGLFPFNTPLKTEGGFIPKLENLAKFDLNTLVGVGFPTLIDINGGFNSIYGIGVTQTTRRENTFQNPSKTKNDVLANYKQKFTPPDTLDGTPFRFASGVSLSDSISAYSELQDIKDNNLEQKNNFGKPGKRELRNDTRDNIDKSKQSGNIRYDRVNASDIKSIDEIDNDLVTLWFKPIDSDGVAQFRGTITGLSDTFSPSWDNIKYNARADSAYKYSTFQRSISFNFRVVATSRIEMQPIWNKLQYLSTMTMAQYPDDNKGYFGTIIRFRLGDLYNNQLAFITALNYSIMDDLSWDISVGETDSKIGQLPKGIDVAITLQILGTSVPKLGATDIYSLPWSGESVSSTGIPNLGVPFLQ